MEDEIKIGDRVSYFIPSLDITLKGTVVEIDGDDVKAKLNTPIEYFKVNKYHLYLIKEGENGNS